MKPAATEFFVHRASAQDAERVYKLGEQVATLPLLRRYGTSPARLAEELRSLASQPIDGREQDLLLAETDGAEELPIGLARLQHGGSGGQFGRGAYLKLIALRPGYTGRGIGHLLLDAVEQRVGQRCSDLFLLASDFNQGAQRFYERRGYLRVGQLPEFACAGITEIIYWKRLES